MLTECLLIYVSYSPASAGRITSLLRAGNVLLMAIPINIRSKITNDNFPMEDIAAEQDALYSNNAIRAMLEGKNSDKLHSMFAFVASFVRRSSGEQHHQYASHVHTNFFELRHLSNCLSIEHAQALQFLPQYIIVLKTSMHC